MILDFCFRMRMRLDILSISTFDYDKVKIGYDIVPHINRENYPCKPDIEFRIAHNGKNIYIHWKVDENDIKAFCRRDGARSGKTLV